MVGEYVGFSLLLGGAVGISSIFLFIGLEFYFRIKSKGATMIVMWDTNREESSFLVKLKGQRSFKVGKDEKTATTFVIDPEKRSARWWPTNFPAWMQHRLPTYYYSSLRTEPIDPTGNLKPRVVSPLMLTQLVNDKMMMITLQEARENAEGQLIGGRRLPLYIAIGVVIILGLNVAGLVYTIKGSKATEQMLAILSEGR